MKTVSLLGKAFLIFSMIFTGFAPALSAFAETTGCTDSFANNYDSNADTYDGSCTYGSSNNTIMADLTVVLNGELDTNAPHYYDLALTIHKVASDYTAESWQPYFDAVNSGLSVERDASSTDADITSAIDQINTTKSNLVLANDLPPAPSVTNDDLYNQVFGMEEDMEWSLDGSNFTMFDKFTFFDTVDLRGDHELRVRDAAHDAVPASAITTLTFTQNTVDDPTVPPAPSLTMDDVANSVTGLDENMEWNIDNTPNWFKYDNDTDDPRDIDFTLLDLSGAHTLRVRVFATASHDAGDITTFDYTGSTDDPDHLPTNPDKSSLSLVHDQYVDGHSTHYNLSSLRLNEADYTSYSWAVYVASVINAALTLENNFATQDQVTIAFNALQAGIDQLELVGEPIPAAPNVSSDDINNVVVGIDETMEFNLDGAGFVTYSTSSLTASDLFGEHVITVRFMATGTTPASEENILIFTSDTPDEPGFGAPDAPDVSADDVYNLIIGIDETMEYSIDSAAFILYNGSTFSTSSLSGQHMVDVRVAASGTLPAGHEITLFFTPNATTSTSTPAAPNVTANDSANTVSRMNSTLEYNLDNAGYLPYGNGIIFNALDFSGNHTLLVRVAATGTTPAGNVTTLTFTTNPVSNGGGNGGGGGGGYGGPFDGLGTLNRGLTIASLVSSPNSAVYGIGGPLLPVTFSSNGQVLGATTFVFSSDLTFGTRSSQVTELQNFLTEAGVYSGPITGFFGPLTLAAVKRYQAQQGLPQTGFVGPLTRGRINAFVQSTNANVLPSQVLSSMTVTELINLLESTGVMTSEKAAQARIVFQGR